MFITPHCFEVLLDCLYEHPRVPVCPSFLELAGGKLLAFDEPVAPPMPAAALGPAVRCRIGWELTSWT